MARIRVAGRGAIVARCTRQRLQHCLQLLIRELLLIAEFLSTPWALMPERLNAMGAVFQKLKKHRPSQSEAVQEEPEGDSGESEEDPLETWFNTADPYYAPHNPPTPPFSSRSPSPIPSEPKHKYNLRSRTRGNSN